MTATTALPHQDLRIEAADGLCLFVRDHAGRADRPPVVCLPGLTRNHRDFAPLAALLAAEPYRRRVVCIDSRGRGGSDRDTDPGRYTLPVEMGDVLIVLAKLGIETADIIGTSRGGLMAHLIGAVKPGLIRRLVLNDIGPRLEPAGIALIKSYVASAATNGETEGAALGPASWETAPDHLRAIHGAHFPALLREDWEEMARAIYRDVDGRPVADYDPAIGRQIADIDLEKPMPEIWEAFATLAPCPLLIVRGEHSTLFSADTAARMCRDHPQATELLARGQGHAPILHHHDLAPTIAAFLDA